MAKERIFSKLGYRVIMFFMKFCFIFLMFLFYMSPLPTIHNFLRAWHEKFSLTTFFQFQVPTRKLSAALFRYLRLFRIPESGFLFPIALHICAYKLQKGRQLCGLRGIIPNFHLAYMLCGKNDKKKKLKKKLKNKTKNKIRYSSNFVRIKSMGFI